MSGYFWGVEQRERLKERVAYWVEQRGGGVCWGCGTEALGAGLGTRWCVVVRAVAAPCERGGWYPRGWSGSELRAVVEGVGKNRARLRGRGGCEV